MATGSQIVDGLPRAKTNFRPTISQVIMEQARLNNSVLLTGNGGSWPASASESKNRIFFLESLAPATGTLTIKSRDAKSILAYAQPYPLTFPSDSPLRFDGGIVFTGLAAYIKGFYVQLAENVNFDII